MEPETASLNAAQIELWNGRGGEIWTRLQARLDRLFEPLTAILLSAAAAKPGESILDIGCGCGDLTLRVAKACGAQSYIRGIDISAPMLERAKAREAEWRAAEPGMGRIEWSLSDAMLHRFEPRADLVMSRFGVMFFADPVVAFTNIRRALKPGGRLAILCWAALDDNPWIKVPLAAVHQLIDPPPPLPDGAPGPFAFADTQRVQAILGEAGFANAAARSVEVPLRLGQASAYAGDRAQSALEDALCLALESGPVAALLRNADETTRLKVREKLAAALQLSYDETRGEIVLAARCRLYEATAAG
ncbi:class I SAM-dependent methyltransferase [Methyloferula stellata]|uniref:class I SAM-dependent methyltransferase n=1 Tax=Methyloferula stellata TaxID=876270 RepID=UPI00035F98D9|nr:class I SAM-dependent methyltransferase [Methyloferula stellata]